MGDLLGAVAVAPLMPARIVVTRRIPEPALELLRAAGDVWVVAARPRRSRRDELHAAVAGADAVVTLLHDRVDDAFLDAAGPQLRVVANVAVGYDNIDVAACSRRGVRRHEHARRADRRHGRHRDGADPDGRRGGSARASA